jgi:hypothetical protein
VTLLKIQFGGNSYDASAAGNQVEIWSCSLHAIAPAAYAPTQVLADDLFVMAINYIADVDTGVASTEALEYLKVNAIDPVTGRQQTDPTIQHLAASSSIRGLAPGQNPMSTSYRVTTDNGTRDRRTRGGWYVPRSGQTIPSTGRYTQAQNSQHVTKAQAFLAAINNYAPVDLTCAVYSKANKGAVPITRVRCGDVPDNISRRRNNLREVYATAALAP